jgi:hypothetical protein
LLSTICSFWWSSKKSSTWKWEGNKYLIVNTQDYCNSKYQLQIQKGCTWFHNDTIMYPWGVWPMQHSQKNGPKNHPLPFFPQPSSI